MAAKTYAYIIVLKRRGFALADRISLFMLVMAVVMLLKEAIAPLSTASIFPFIIIVLVIGWCVFVHAQKKNGNIHFYRIGLLLAALGIVMAIPPPYKWIGFIYIIAAAMEKQVKFPREIAFDEEEIVFNTFPRKHYQWNELSNVILKDGLLTIDFKNNKLLQKEIDSAGSAKLEQDFNEFCSTMLNAERRRG